MQQALLTAQSKHHNTTEKLAIIEHYKKYFNLSINYKCVERMDPLELEMSFRMLRLEQKLSHAATCIVSCLKGIKTRRRLRNLLARRKLALLFLQAQFKGKILKRQRDEKLRNAATLIQRYCKGHLVAKHYIHIIGDASIDKSLFSFRVMKNEIGRQLANLLYFYWRVYQRTLERKRKEEAERKKKAKGKKKKKGSNAQRRDSVMSTKSNFTVSKSH